MELEYDYQILKLTDEFYKDYPFSKYKEIEQKSGRRYNCLLIQTHYDYFICVPFRSNVRHKYCFRFKTSKRSKDNKSALDYSKIVIIKNKNYIDTIPGIIDRDEYREMVVHIDFIAKSAVRYIEDYVKYMKNEESRISGKEFERRYKYSSIRYFNKILGIKNI